jgi:hypothetical protein
MDTFSNSAGDQAAGLADYFLASKRWLFADEGVIEEVHFFATKWRTWPGR